jgi:hypothetical protein
MARRVFLFLVVPANLAASAKQKSSAPPLTHDEFTRAQLASRFDLAGEPSIQHPVKNGQTPPAC